MKSFAPLRREHFHFFSKARMVFFNSFKEAVNPVFSSSDQAEGSIPDNLALALPTQSICSAGVAAIRGFLFPEPLSSLAAFSLSFFQAVIMPRDCFLRAMVTSVFRVTAGLARHSSRTSWGRRFKEMRKIFTWIYRMDRMDRIMKKTEWKSLSCIND